MVLPIVLEEHTFGGEDLTASFVGVRVNVFAVDRVTVEMYGFDVALESHAFPEGLGASFVSGATKFVLFFVHGNMSSQLIGSHKGLATV